MDGAGVAAGSLDVPSGVQPTAASEPTPAVRVTSAHGVRAVYEHPLAVRFTHWLNAVSILVLAMSGLRIFTAFPSFGPKIPQKDFVDIPAALTLGGWLGGALQWHFTFMWVFAGAGVLYVVTQAITGRYRMILFRPRDVPGVWPMARHYFLFGPKPPLTEPYNPLQKLAYTGTILLGTLSLLTGLVLYKPVRFSALADVFGGYRLTRIWHFAAMCGLLAFVPGHLLMVAVHGWNNFAGMLTGWNKGPEYLPDQAVPIAADEVPPGTSGAPVEGRVPSGSESREPDVAGAGSGVAGGEALTTEESGVGPAPDAEPQPAGGRTDGDGHGGT